MSTFNGFSECQLPACNQQSWAVCGWQKDQGEQGSKRGWEKKGGVGWVEGKKAEERSLCTFLMGVIMFNAALYQLIFFGWAELEGSVANTGVCL